jgi:imidazolonepropionase-like amidohydrolase
LFCPQDDAVPSQTLSSASGSLALVGGTIYTSPTEETVQDGVVLIEDGKIVGVGPRASIQLPQSSDALDCSGLTITAGFWNSHVHFFERKWADAETIPAAELGQQLQEMLTRYGFTSAFDTGSMWANTRVIRERIESGEVPGPRIHSTGEALVARGAIPPEMVFNLMGSMTFPAPEIADEAHARAASRKLLDEGVDAIKLHLQSPPAPHSPFPESAMSAVVNEAHRSGRPVFVHPNTSADVLASVRAGVDVIGHTTPRSGPWDEKILEAMTRGRVALTPTLTLWKSFLRHDRISMQGEMVDTAVGQLRAWAVSGGAVLFGTDLGAVDYDPREEYALMAQAGLSFREILASLTVAPAERFGETERLGRIVPGLEADLVVLKGDPAVDIRALTDVKFTLRSGKVLYR